jgi:hypothetical protein
MPAEPVAVEALELRRVRPVAGAVKAAREAAASWNVVRNPRGDLDVHEARDHDDVAGRLWRAAKREGAAVVAVKVLAVKEHSCVVSSVAGCYLNGSTRRVHIQNAVEE